VPDHSVSAVIPVYNSEKSLPEVVARLHRVLRAECDSFEILLVNDGSRDRSQEALERLSREFPHVRGINLSRNYGQHNALLCGLRAAQYPVIVTLDDDLQHPPEHIPRLLRTLEDGHDVVYGTPEREAHSGWRVAGSRFMKWVLRRVLNVPSGGGISAFRVFRTSLRDAFHDYRSPHVMIDVLLSWGTTRFTAVSVPHQLRHSGASNYTLPRLVAHAVYLLTGFSTVPLRLASWVGFGSMIFGLLVLAWVLGNYAIRGTSQPGFPFLASIIAIFSGAQLFALGILGEYMVQIHFRLMDKPPYVIRDLTAQVSSRSGPPPWAEEAA
jgi:undecaprenyl-phosphate 4-deoxy-4-formamido-L-arabinose transferase